MYLNFGISDHKLVRISEFTLIIMNLQQHTIKNCGMFLYRKNFHILNFLFALLFQDIDFLLSSAALSKEHFGYQIRFDVS